MNATELTDYVVELVQQVVQQVVLPAGAAAAAAAPNALYAAAAGSVLLVPAAVALLYKKCVRVQRGQDEADCILSQIHTYASASPDSNLNKLCIQLLRENPEMVNKTLPEQQCVSHGYTPFLRACWNNNFELIHYMLSIGADIRLANSDGESALYLVAYRVSKSSKWDARGLNLLWNAGCSVDEVNVYNISMLHLAAKAGSAPLARWLLLHGADAAVVSSAGYTPRTLALKKGSPAHMVVASLLRRPDHGARVRRHFVCRDDGVQVTRSNSSPLQTHSQPQPAAVDGSDRFFIAD